MRRLVQFLVVIAAFVIIAVAVYFGHIMVDLALDYPRRRAGESPEFPEHGTFAYFWNCALQLARMFALMIPPFAATFGTALLALTRVFKPSPQGWQTSRGIGLAIVLILTLHALFITLPALYAERDLTRFGIFILPQIPAVILLFIPHWWPHALFVISSWFCLGLFAFVLFGETVTKQVTSPEHLGSMAFLLSVLCVQVWMALQKPVRLHS